MNYRNAVLALLCLAIATSVGWAQVSGRLSGTVTDPTGQVIVAADVTITNAGTSEQRMVQSNEAGNFVFAALPPGTYALTVQSEGFQSYEQTGIIISADQALAIGNIPLSIGAVTETVTVQAEGAAVETDTAGVNALLTSNQMDGLMQRGRDIVALLTVLPGVAQVANSDALGGNWGSRTPNFSGAKNGWNNFMLDGMPGNDIDDTTTFHVSVSMDAIQEVSVKSTAYQAEYGRVPGAQVNIISKSGTNEFHGSGYWFKRNEVFNANSFDNNRFGSPKPLYRFDTVGGVLGGPVKKDKMFFFVSREGLADQEAKPPAPRHGAHGDGAGRRFLKQRGAERGIDSHHRPYDRGAVPGKHGPLPPDPSRRTGHLELHAQSDGPEPIRRPRNQLHRAVAVGASEGPVAVQG